MPSVETNGVETHYEVTGDGPPIVFIHGATSDRQLWKPVIERLSNEYRCIAYDVRGHGRTGGSDRDEYSVELFADDLHELVTKLGLDAPILFGLSLGGMIAQTYAVRHGDSLRAMVVSGAPTPELSGLGERLFRVTMPRVITPPIKLVGYQRMLSAINWVQLQLFDEEAAGDLDEIDRIRDEEPEMTTEEVIKLFGALRSFHLGSLPLESIDVPTLALVGEREIEMMHYHHDVLGDRVSDVRTKVIPEAGHNAHVDNPDWIAEEVRGFLGED